MKSFSSVLKFIFVGFFFSFLLVKEAVAVEFSLIAPSGLLQRGQQVTFTIDIDTKGEALTTTQIGFTYDTQYLEYINTTPGNTFTTISVSQVESGKLVILGTQSPGFSGQGVFAYVNLKLIAQAPGSTELCVLWAPSPTPTNQPTNQPTQTPTNPPAAQPTALPRSGNYQTIKYGACLAVLFFLIAGLSFFHEKIKLLSVHQLNQAKKYLHHRKKK